MFTQQAINSLFSKRSFSLGKILHRHSRKETVFCGSTKLLNFTKVLVSEVLVSEVFSLSTSFNSADNSITINRFSAQVSNKEIVSASTRILIFVRRGANSLGAL